MDERTGLHGFLKEFKSGLDRKKATSEYVRKYPKTPNFVVEAIAGLIYEQKSKSNVDVNELLTNVGRYMRKIVVDFGWKGNSSSGCWDFSVKLRDTYNFVFQEMCLNKKALLIHGDFGVGGSSSNHHWVSVISTDDQNGDVDKLSREGIFVDGTVDQYKGWRGLTESQRNFFSNKPLLISQPTNEDSIRDFYSMNGISPVPSQWFV